MTYLAHYNCFLEEKPDDSPFVEKVGFFDIETFGGFNADFGYVNSYAIRGSDGCLLGRVLSTSEIRKGKFDEALLSELCKSLFKFNRIVVHYGADRKFDIPFVRTRALKYGYDFPLYKDIYVTDTWAICDAKLKLRNNRLGTVCGFFGIEAKTHPMTEDVWLKSSIGDKDALEYIWVHNVEDVDSLKALYEKIVPFVNKGKRSI